MNRKIAIYGAGNKMLEVEAMISKYIPKAECNYAIENKQFSKIGMSMNSRFNPEKPIEIVSLHTLERLHQEGKVDVVVFPTSYHLFDCREIVSLCKKIGFSEEEILAVPIDILKKEELEEEDLSRILVPYHKLEQLYHTDIHITDHCNIKCKGCAHFSSLVEGEVSLSVGEFQKNLNRLKELIPNLCSIAILGGEPLLHPELNIILDIARTIYPYAYITVVTNGILLTKMNPELIESLKKNGVKLDISIYPVLKGNIERWLKFLRKHNLEYSMNEFDQFERRLWSEPVFDGSEMTKRCGHDLCIRNEFIARCPIMLFTDYYNKRFGDKLPVEKGINLFEVNSGMELIELLEQSKELCNYCCARDQYYEEWESVTDQTMKETDWFMKIPKQFIKK